MSTQPHQFRRAEYWVAILLAVVALGWVLVSVFAGGDAVLAQLSRVTGETLAIMLALSLVNYGIRCVRWLLMTRWLGFELPLGENSLYYLAGLAFGPTPGKIGDALRLWLMGRHYHVRVTRLAPLFVGDRLGDMNAMVLLGVVSMSAFPDHRGLAILAAVGCILATFAVMWPRPVFMITARLYDHVRGKARRLLVTLRRMLRDCADLMTPGRYGLVLLLSLLGWAAEALAFHVVLQNLDIDISLLAATFVFAFSVTIGGVSLSPGGVGSTEATMIALLTLLGADFDRALVATAVIRATSLWFGTALGFGLLPVVLRRARKAAEQPA